MYTTYLVLDDGEEKIVSYRLQIEGVKSSAVKNLFEYLENSTEEYFKKNFEFKLMEDTARLLDFYNIDLSICVNTSLPWKNTEP